MSGESGLEADADGRDAGRPLSVGQAPVDLLPVERVQGVAVLAVVPDDDERKTTLLLCSHDHQMTESSSNSVDMPR